VEFHSKNKFEKLVHLVGFIIRNLTWCTVTWTSNAVLLSIPKWITLCVIPFTYLFSGVSGGTFVWAKDNIFWVEFLVGSLEILKWRSHCDCIQ
jgi:hypothetical protein